MSELAFSVGQKVFFDHPEDSWVIGEVASAPDKKKLYNLTVAGKGTTVKGITAAQIYPISNDGILTEDCHDLLSLTELHNATLLHAVRRRYLEDVVYTYIGPIVIALNPFNYNIPWYRDDFMPNYLSEGPVIQKNKPHSWSVAHNTFFELLADQANQSVLVSGESGAGKTEAVKIVIKYVKGLMMSRAKDEAHRTALDVVNRKVLLASPILETFGNAKTGRNDNSSRFGKFLQLHFDSDGFLVGSSAIPYLLEKSRVVVASGGERIYHAFYQLAKGKDAATYGITDLNVLPSLVSGGVVDNASMDDADGDDLSYRMTNEAFAVCGVPEAGATSVWRLIAAILHCQRVVFAADPADPDAGTVAPDSLGALAQAAEFWGIDAATLQTELTSTTSTLRGETFTVKHSVAMCQTMRNSLSQILYKVAFDWLFDSVNAATVPPPSAKNWIGLLDIFGFEDFAVNSFEQLCINLANETLQNHYNDYIFTRDMEECKAEGIDVAQIQFVDNTPTVVLLTTKMGVFSLLDEECALGNGSDAGFLHKITEKHGAHPSFVRKSLWRTAFAIKHYAGTVKYEIDAFLAKNKEQLKDSFKLMFRASTDALVASLLPEPNPDKKGRDITVSGFFTAQIKALMDTINSTNPHWIRCIKPHPAKKPLMFDGQAVMSQMVNSGIVETVRIRMLGYPIRIPHKEFVHRFAILARRNGLKATAENILQATALTAAQAQVGKTKVFLKAAVYHSVEEVKRAALRDNAMLVQAYCRCAIGKERVKAILYESFRDIIEAIKAAKAAMDDLLSAEQQQRQSIVGSYDVETPILGLPYEELFGRWKLERSLSAECSAAAERMYADFVASRATLEEKIRIEKLIAWIAGQLVTMESQCAAISSEIKREESEAWEALELLVPRSIAAAADREAVRLENEAAARQALSTRAIKAFESLRDEESILAFELFQAAETSHAQAAAVTRERLRLLHEATTALACIDDEEETARDDIFIEEEVLRSQILRMFNVLFEQKEARAKQAALAARAIRVGVENIAAEEFDRRDEVENAEKKARCELYGQMVTIHGQFVRLALSLSTLVDSALACSNLSTKAAAKLQPSRPISLVERTGSVTIEAIIRQSYDSATQPTLSLAPERYTIGKLAPPVSIPPAPSKILGPLSEDVKLNLEERPWSPGVLDAYDARHEESLAKWKSAASLYRDRHFVCMSSMSPPDRAKDGSRRSASPHSTAKRAPFRKLRESAHAIGCHVSAELHGSSNQASSHANCSPPRQPPSRFAMQTPPDTPLQRDVRAGSTLTPRQPPGATEHLRRGLSFSAVGVICRAPFAVWYNVRISLDADSFCIVPVEGLSTSTASFNTILLPTIQIAAAEIMTAGAARNNGVTGPPKLANVLLKLKIRQLEAPKSSTKRFNPTMYLGFRNQSDRMGFQTVLNAAKGH